MAQHYIGGGGAIGMGWDTAQQWKNKLRSWVGGCLGQIQFYNPLWLSSEHRLDSESKFEPSVTILKFAFTPLICYLLLLATCYLLLTTLYYLPLATCYMLLLSTCYFILLVTCFLLLVSCCYLQLVTCYFLFVSCF